MATEVTLPTEDTAERTTDRTATDRNQQFWNKNGKILVILIVGIIVLIGAYLAYLSFVKEPKERKASEAMWKAEEYYRMDSARLALNGDGSNIGFLQIISRYGGTKAGNLAEFYAGSSYLKIGDFNNAVKYLKDFSTDDELDNNE